mmetsp:Transcript_39505/g.72361  ORF Transcript_39505/g.72361 Transcript_39505/m.72361 type:complete len:122 (+) Transcript_39505:448-813(+)
MRMAPSRAMLKKQKKKKQWNCHRECLSWYQLECVYGMAPEQASREFDSLRREATKLERHLEDRVARYQQVSPLWMCLGSLLIVWRFLSGFLPYDLPGRFVRYTADVIDVFWGVIIMILFKM